MPLKYKPPRFWEHKKELSYPYVGHWEYDAFKMLVERIPEGSEAKVVIRWSRTRHQKQMVESDKLIDKWEKELKDENE